MNRRLALAGVLSLAYGQLVRFPHGSEQAHPTATWLER